MNQRDPAITAGAGQPAEVSARREPTAAEDREALVGAKATLGDPERGEKCRGDDRSASRRPTVRCCPGTSRMFMQRCLIIAVASACFLGAAVPRGHAGSAKNGDYRAKATAFLAADLTPQSGSKPDFTVKLVDLNGDGIPEALAIDQSVGSCGSHGCAAYILDLTGPKARSMADLLGFDLSALPTKTGGWLDVGLSSTTVTKLVHRGDKYVFSR